MGRYRIASDVGVYYMTFSIVEWLVLRPENWRFSSALFWLTGEACDVNLADVGWD